MTKPIRKACSKLAVICSLGIAATAFQNTFAEAALLVPSLSIAQQAAVNSDVIPRARRVFGMTASSGGSMLQ